MLRIEAQTDGRGACDPAGSSFYLYAFVDTERKLESFSSNPNAEASADFRLFRAGTVAALAAPTPTADFIGAVGERNLDDPAWVAARCRRHEAVLELAMRDGAVFPVGFGTLFSSAEVLLDFVGRHERQIAGFLRETADHEEWEVSAFATLDAHDLLERTAASEWPDFLSLSAGARYLRLCRERTALIASAKRLACRAAVSLLSELQHELRPSNAVLRPPRPRLRVTGNEINGEQVGSLVLLIRSEQAAALRTTLGSLNPARVKVGSPLRLAVSGPWPPYSFRPTLD
ncbi:GvpL/GvpF family gas vesicle protein [Methylosinus sp. KRF6]|uniref:GvpL/GvpF family gas vesicle protein n=1 Tax=Methylosinus sp. KRF6 TaxID=2846853 RepID=UPI001C0CD07A|nr:GvpL/GvpF family gas vesicle protein [Methylosinus sp. KRF6]MBU3890913.1 GvpL/GvpF family gas vesicle protein [Methylosinus sp. KRF6]